MVDVKDLLRKLNGIARTFCHGLSIAQAAPWFYGVKFQTDTLPESFLASLYLGAGKSKSAPKRSLSGAAFFVVAHGTMGSKSEPAPTRREKQVPHRAFGPVRNDRGKGGVRLTARMNGRPD